MPGPPPKLASRRQRRGGTSLVVCEGDGAVVAPELPGGLLKATRQWWAQLWADPIASVFEPSDVGALRRLATLVDERERAFRAFRRGRVVAGSKGQPRLHPLGRLVADLDVEIRNLEDRFGLSPQARLRLGVQFAESARSLDELNRRLNVDMDEGDPLLEVVD